MCFSISAGSSSSCSFSSSSSEAGDAGEIEVVHVPETPAELLLGWVPPQEVRIKMETDVGRRREERAAAREGIVQDEVRRHVNSKKFPPMITCF